MTRYARQTSVAAFGTRGQARLRAARVLVVGAGGLAAPVLQYLVGAGLGHIRLVDPDRVERGNLHRQTLFREADVGMAKVTAAAATLAALNPDCIIEAVRARLDPGNAASLADGADLVLDCADSFAVSYILSDLCRDTGQPFASASVLGLEGYVGAFCGGAPSLRAVFPDLPQRLDTCAEAGVLGPVLGVLGGVQAQMALALIAGIAPSPLGRLISYDARLHRFGGFDFMTAPEPPRTAPFIASDAITARDFVIDLRAEAEGPLVRPGALRLPPDAFGPASPRPASGQRAVLCCRSGLRAWTAAERLRALWSGDIALVALGDPDGETV